MEKLNRFYTVEECLASGSLADIYLVRNISDNKLYAAKYINKRAIKFDFYHNECEILRFLRDHPHPNIVNLKEIIKDEESVFIIQEFLPNGDLLNFCNKYKPKEKRIRELFRGIISAVAQLHILGIAHRDLKLDNIMVDADMQPRVVDFNLSCFWKRGEKQNQFCGTLQYTSPEMIRKIPYYGPEVDVWSLGVILYALLFRKLPFDSDGDEPATNSDVQLQSPHKEKDKDSASSLGSSDSVTKAKEEEAANSKKLRRTEMMKKIVAGKFTFPPCHHVSMEACDLISKLLEVNPAKRLNSQVIHKHPWFTTEFERLNFVQRNAASMSDALSTGYSTSTSSSFASLNYSTGTMTPQTFNSASSSPFHTPISGVEARKFNVHDNPDNRRSFFNETYSKLTQLFS